MPTPSPTSQRQAKRGGHERPATKSAGAAIVVGDEDRPFGHVNVKRRLVLV